jgi:small subunit ribosomal protein S1
MSENFKELFEQSVQNWSMQAGDIIHATVLQIHNGFVLVDAGLKSEASIPLEQFKDDAGEITLKVGDTVEVALEAIEDNHGATRLSHEKAKRAKMWTKLEAAHENDEIVQGLISARVKGGFTVDINDVRAFLPGSLVDVRPLRDTSFLEGKMVDLKVIKVDAKRNNIVVSRRAVLETEGAEERDALLES